MKNAEGENPPDQKPKAPPPAFDELNAAERQRINAFCTKVDQFIAGGGVPNLEQLVQKIEPRLRVAFLEQLLPSEIKYLTESRKRPPTLYELAVLFPNLEKLLVTAYRRLSPEVRLPDTLGQYRILRIVGSGEQGKVAIGRHKRNKQTAAIKFSRDAEPSRRLLQEAAFLSRLKGLNVPAIIDDGRSPDGTAYFVMEALNGKSLQQLIDEDGPIQDPIEIAKLMRQCAETLQQIHKGGVLHRDLAPKNILVDEDGVVRMIDFGLAIDDTAGPILGEQITEFHGTKAYMAPEQIAGDGKADGKLCEVFALGRILLFLAAGQEIVRATMPQVKVEAAAAHLANAGAMTAAIGCNRLAQICAKATNPDPRKRFRSAGALASTLGSYVRGTTFRRRVRSAAIKAAVLAAIAAGVAWGAREHWDKFDIQSLFPSAPAPSRLADADLVVALPSDAVPPEEENGPLSAPEAVIVKELSTELIDPLPRSDDPPEPAVEAPAVTPNPIEPRTPAESPPPMKAASPPVDDTEPKGANLPSGIVISEDEQTATNSANMPFVLIPAGKFLMGSPDTETMRQTEERRHQVQITRPFYLARHETTQAEWLRVRGTNPAGFSVNGGSAPRVALHDTADFPAEHITWYDAVEFCNWLSDKEGLPEYYSLTAVQRAHDSISAAAVTIAGGNGYRLPTEAEWEYACRAGTATPFAFGTSTNGVEANIKGLKPYRSSSPGPNLERPSRVEQYAPNAFGLFDMHGNVYEWCFDNYFKDAYRERRAMTIDPVVVLAPQYGDPRVARGGAWSQDAQFARSAFRHTEHAALSRSHVGFRVAKDK